MNRAGTVLYAASMMMETDGEPGGKIVAYPWDTSTGRFGEGWEHVSTTMSGYTPRSQDHGKLLDALLRLLRLYKVFNSDQSGRNGLLQSAGRSFRYALTKR